MMETRNSVGKRNRKTCAGFRIPSTQNNNDEKSSIVNEVVKAIYLFFYEDILHTKKAYKAPKQRLLRYPYMPKSIIKHTGDFHLDIIKKASELYPDISIRLKRDS